jgi:uncharacterized protein YjlB
MAQCCSRGKDRASSRCDESGHYFRRAAEFMEVARLESSLQFGGRDGSSEGGGGVQGGGTLNVDHTGVLWI